MYELWQTIRDKVKQTKGNTTINIETSKAQSKTNYKTNYEKYGNSKTQCKTKFRNNY